MTHVLHLIDDDTGFRTALARLLRTIGHAVREYDSAEAFLAAGAPAPGCLLLDVHMPGLSGIELQEHLTAHASRVPIIFITGQGDIPMSVRAIKAGAEDFLTKPVGRAALEEAIARALDHVVRNGAQVALQEARTRQLALLSNREREVAVLLAEGWLNKRVAASLGTTERTIKAHRASIMEKLGIRSVVELARLLDPRQ
jgi:FixJ family two-component response regulator